MRLEQIIRSLQTLQTRLQTHSFPAPYYVMARIGQRWFTEEELTNANRDLLNPDFKCTAMPVDNAVAKTQTINSNISTLLEFFRWHCSHAFRKMNTPTLYALHNVRTDTSTRLRALAREVEFKKPQFELRFYNLDMQKFAELKNHPFIADSGGIDLGEAVVGVEVLEDGELSSLS